LEVFRRNPPRLSIVAASNESDESEFPYAHSDADEEYVPTDPDISPKSRYLPVDTNVATSLGVHHARPDEARAGKRSSAIRREKVKSVAKNLQGYLEKPRAQKSMPLNLGWMTQSLPCARRFYHVTPDGHLLTWYNSHQAATEGKKDPNGAIPLSSVLAVRVTGSHDNHFKIFCRLGTEETWANAKKHSLSSLCSIWGGRFAI